MNGKIAVLIGIIIIGVGLIAGWQLFLNNNQDTTTNPNNSETVDTSNNTGNNTGETTDNNEDQTETEGPKPPAPPSG